MATSKDLVRTHGAAAVLMVHATPEAEAAANKSGMSIVDLLRPFSLVDGAFTISTVGDPYQLKGFSLRFVHTSEFKELAGDTSEQHLAHLLSLYDCSAELAELERLDSSPQSALQQAAPSMPWVRAFREHLADALRNSEGASLDHPVGCVLVASAAQTKPVAVFNALLASANQTSVIADGLADPGFPRSCILLHDVSDSTANVTVAESALAEASRSFGAASCHLLAINSRASTAPLPADIWKAARPLHVPAAGSEHGAASGLPVDSPLAVEDIDRLRKLIEGPLTKQVVASLQTRVAALSSTVKAARTGLQNKLRSWLGGRATHHGHGSAPLAAGAVTKEGSVRYVCGSIEAQTRQLADCAFLLGDYGTALTAYRQAATDFKGDKAWWHYAAALEMASICARLPADRPTSAHGRHCAPSLKSPAPAPCEWHRSRARPTARLRCRVHLRPIGVSGLHCTDGPWKDMDEAAEKAATTYLKLSGGVGDRPARHATRAVLLQMDLLAHAPPKKREQATRDVAQALVDQSTQESSLCAALLLEQAALSFRSARAPMQRKFAFYLILAGYRYISCSQRRHAVRTYASALRVYSGKGWSHIEDHVHFTLGRNCTQLGRIEIGALPVNRNRQYGPFCLTPCLRARSHLLSTRVLSAAAAPLAATGGATADILAGARRDIKGAHGEGIPALAAGATVLMPLDSGAAQ